MTTHPQRVVELMHAEIDGLNAPVQTQELEEYLASHAGAREEFNALSALAKRLREQPQVEPPPHLIHRILSAIPFGRYPHRAHAGGGLGQWIAGLLPRPRLRYVATFAVGLVAGFVLLWAAVSDDGAGQPLDISHFYGTMNAVNPTDGFDVVGTLGVEADGVRGEIRLHESNKRLLADVALHAEDEIQWVLRYDRSDVALDGFRQLAGTQGDVVAAGDQASVKQTGNGRYVLFFTERGSAPAPMTVEIFRSGNLLYKQQLASKRGH